MELTLELLRRHVRWLIEGLNSPGYKVYKNYAPRTIGTSQIMNDRPIASDAIIVRAHKKHSKLGKTFDVRQYIKKLSGIGSITDPVTDTTDKGFKQKYQIKIDGIRPESKIDPNTLWVKAKDKNQANELARQYARSRTGETNN